MNKNCKNTMKPVLSASALKDATLQAPNLDTKSIASSGSPRSESHPYIASDPSTNPSALSFSSKQSGVFQCSSNLADMTSSGCSLNLAEIVPNGSTQANCRLSLPARLGTTTHAGLLSASDSNKSKESKVNTVCFRLNPFLDGTYDNVQESKSSVVDMASTESKEILSIVLDLNADKAQAVQVHEDLKDAASETVDFDVAFAFPTFQEKPSRLLDTTSGLSSTDLALLKENDAFQYYSLPAVKRAHWEGRDVDFDIELSGPVVRCSAISFETPDIPILGDVSSHLDECNPNEGTYSEGGHGNVDGEEDLFMSLFM